MYPPGRRLLRDAGIKRVRHLLPGGEDLPLQDLEAFQLLGREIVRLDQHRAFLLVRAALRRERMAMRGRPCAT